MISLPEFLPGTSQPAPNLMTAEEACMYLRLDEGRTADNAVKALARLVEKKLIRPCLVGKWRRYSRHELDRFIERQTDRYAPPGD